MSNQFDKKREELLDEIRDILTNAEELFDEKSKSGEAELKKLKANLSSRINQAKAQFETLQEQTVIKAKDAAKQVDTMVHDNPYKSIAIAGAFGLLLGVLIGKK